MMKERKSERKEKIMEPTRGGGKRKMEDEEEEKESERDTRARERGIWIS